MMRSNPGGAIAKGLRNTKMTSSGMDIFTRNGQKAASINSVKLSDKSDFYQPGKAYCYVMVYSLDNFPSFHFWIEIQFFPFILTLHFESKLHYINIDWANLNFVNDIMVSNSPINQ